MTTRTLAPDYEAWLRKFYGAAYDHLKRHPEFDGRPRPGHPALMRRDVDPATIKPWPGAADARRLSRDEWVDARLEGVCRGTEQPGILPKEGDIR